MFWREDLCARCGVVLVVGAPIVDDAVVLVVTIVVGLGPEEGVTTVQFACANELFDGAVAVDGAAVLFRRILLLVPPLATTWPYPGWSGDKQVLGNVGLPWGE
jgi:hypothetical protein